jgi:hypothetical protein
MFIWSILRPFGIFVAIWSSCGHLVYLWPFGILVAIWYILRLFDIFFPIWFVVPRKIWQPWTVCAGMFVDKSDCFSVAGQWLGSDNLCCPSNGESFFRMDQLKMRFFFPSAYACCNKKSLLSLTFGVLNCKVYIVGFLH